MDFLKKHYEKVLLGVVLLGLAIAVGFLPFKVASEKQKLTEMSQSVLYPKVKELPNQDLTLPNLALKRVATPYVLDFSAPHRLFNPMAWQKAADGHLIPQGKVGPSRLTVTNITPLYLTLRLDSVTLADSGAKYVIVAERQAFGKTPESSYCKVNDKTKIFTLVEVKGKPEEPSELVVQLNDTNERGVITKEKAFKRVDAYAADLYYDLEKKTWKGRRVGATLPFNGEDYKIVAINENEVILSAPNQKKWTIKYNPNVAP